MKIAHFDCFAGASGDMILASLFDVGLTEEKLLAGLTRLGITGVAIKAEDVFKQGVRAKSFRFTSSLAEGRKTHSEIAAMIGGSSLSGRVKAGSLAAFDLLATAEGRIHGVARDDVHFHEIGALDSIVDVVGAFLGLEELGIERATSSPLVLGGGCVDCQHGVLPVPAPATLEIAKGLPIREWNVEGELTTPTGAAILRACSSGFGPIPSMVVSQVGYGAGSCDLAGVPNILRLIVGEACQVAAGPVETDRVVLIEANIDDMNPQFFSHVYDDLFEAGALDVWVSNIMMKKTRPGFLLSVLAAADKLPSVAQAMFGKTTTAGVRFRDVERLKLPRSVLEVETKHGKVRVKVFNVDSVERVAPEYEDCLRISRARGVSIDEVIEEAKHAYRRCETGEP